MNFELMIRHITQMKHGEQLRVQMMRFGVSLLLMMVVGVNTAWGATVDFNGPDGYYYFGNHAGANSVPVFDTDPSHFEQNFYMCPAYKSPADANNYLDGTTGEKPFITTFKSFTSNNVSYTNAIWYLEAATGANAGYYYIKHVESGKYLVANDNDTPAANRRRVNLVSKDDGAEKPFGDYDPLFKIQTDDDGVTYYISSKTKSNGNNKYLNPSSKNLDDRSATSDNKNTGGIIGFYSVKNENSAWHFIPALSERSRKDAPIVFNVAGDKSTVTLSCSNTDVSLYYTIGSYDDDSSNPDDPKCISATNITGTLYDGSAIPTTDGKRNVIKVIAVITEDGVTYSSPVAKKTVDRREDTAPAYDGVYYLQNKADNRYYLYPKDATIITKQAKDLPAVWKLEKIAGTGAHHIIHYSDNKYLVANVSSITNTLSLTTTNSPDENALFVVEKVGDNYTIKPLNADNAGGNNYLNPTGGNNGTNTIGLYTADDNGSKWVFGKVPAPPTFTVSDLVVTINKSFGDVYYKVDNRDISTDDATAPSVISGSPGTKGNKVTLKYGPRYRVNAICAYCYDSQSNPKKYWESDNVYRDVQVALLKPTLSHTGNTVTISSIQNGVSFKYTTDGSDPKTSGTAETGASFTLAEGSIYTVRAYAFNIVEGITYWSASEDVLYVNLKDQTPISSLSEITDQAGNYILSSTFGSNGIGTPQYNIGTSGTPFKGKIEGYWDETKKEYKPISLSAPLFEYVEDAVIKNIIVSSGDISGNGAITAVANGKTRIYNCGYLGGTITGSSGNVGGLVGEINDESRVINCFSFATVKGGSVRGGIVGSNNSASTSDNIRTMVMNCIFYGDIPSGGAPVYGGTMIDNNAANKGLNNFNYFSFDDFKGTISPYNCALAAEKDYLQRFEFHRNILNSNRELAAWYATGSTSNSDQMAKWVLETADPTNENPKPYPVLKKQAYYPSVINYENAPVLNDDFSVSISQGSYAPTGASINSSKTLKVYDKDIANHHYNYRTIRLPYYCEVGGTLNYTSNKVMTGWDVTVTGGSANFTDASASKNFANRDNYSGRVFSQGAYLDIPDGATVSITSHWADCVYLCDANYDVTYNTSYAVTPVTAMGTRYGSAKKFNDQTVYNTFSAAVSALGNINTTGDTKTVHNKAIVLVGNYHQYCKATALANVTDPFTVMSADLNNDCEPDYSFFYQHTQRHQIAPVRFDFLNFPGIGLGQKVDGTGNMAAQGIFVPRGWFEITNTCLVHFTQFEYDSSSKTSISPVILLGGIYDQFVSANDFNVGKTSYLHLGSNAYFPNEFCNGTHGDKSWATPHIPISVTGGEYKDFYLSGMFNPDVVPIADNASCYVDGGYFSEEVAGAGQEKIDGNVTWYIANADITNFYGGGINDAKSITGDITVNIKNSRVDQYCGGPKFGNMSDGKKITTTATDNCIFGKFFGAGYGGTSLYQRRTQNDYKKANYSWSTWAGEYDTAFDGGYNATYHGVPTSYKYEYVDRSGAEDNTKVGRFYINYASLSLAVTHDVESTLTDCTIKSDFFGGGNLGMVNGNIESTLTDCTVHGSVFGGGFSATPPTVDVWPKNSFGAPSYNDNAGVYIPGEYPDTEEEGMIVYTWSHDKGSASSPLTKEGNNYWIYTAKDTENNKDLSKLGQVTGDVTLTIDGESKVGKILHGIWDKTQNKLVVDTNNENSSEGGGVFGGGDASAVLGSTIVILKDKAEIEGDVFGGGNKANVTGSATVNIEQ